MGTLVQNNLSHLIPPLLRQLLPTDQMICRRGRYSKKTCHPSARISHLTNRYLDQHFSGIDHLPLPGSGAYRRGFNYMEVIGHKRPRIEGKIFFPAEICSARYKILPVLYIPEDFSTFYSSVDDIMKDHERTYSWLSWHVSDPYSSLFNHKYF
jgi:hypothetical protein